MKIWRLNISLAKKSTGRVGGVTLPRSRVSDPDDMSYGKLMSVANGYLSFLQPKVPVQMLDLISKFCMVNPDFAQAVSNIVYLGNNGHQVVVTADSDRKMNSAVKRLNETAMRIKIDNLINRLLRQMVINGALSVEWIPRMDLSGIDTFALVPVRSIRFKYSKDAGRYLPYQYTSKGEYIELNESTYIYSALEQEEDSPYAIPPFIAALPNAVIQIYMMDNLKYVVKKFGLLGFFDIVLKAPERGSGETDDKYRERLQAFVNEYAKGFEDNYRDGTAVHLDDAELKHHALTADARGIKDIVEINELLVMSGLKQDPAMMGRSYSTTETYAGVVYSKLVNEIDNYRRQVRAAVEYAYTLDLLMFGVTVNKVALSFSGNASFKPKEGAETQKIVAETAITKMEAGLISPDQAAQELGYEKAYMPEFRDDTGGRFTASFLWTASGYQLVRERIKVKRQEAEQEQITERVNAIKLASEKGIEGKRLRWVGWYFKGVMDVDTRARKLVIDEVKKKLLAGGIAGTTPDEFADEILAYIEERHPEALKSLGMEDTVRRSVSRVYTHYRLRDKVLAKVKRIPAKLTMPDKRAIKFLGGLDDFYISKYLQNESARWPILNFLKASYLEEGVGDIDGFIKRFEKEFANVSKTQLRMIADTSVSRLRHAGHVRQLATFEIKTCEIVEVMDRVTCPQCREVDGKTFRVKEADTRLQKLYELSAEEFNRQVYEDASPQWKKGGEDAANYASGKSGDQLVSENIFVPLHPRCRGRIVSV